MKRGFLKSRRRKELDNIRSEHSTFKIQIQKATQFITEIENGNFQVHVPEQLFQSELGEALESLKKRLSSIAEQEEVRNWLNSGLARFSDILRNKNSLSLEDLANEILSNLVKYVKANQGAVFLLEGEKQENDQHLKMIACYAYERKKYMDRRIELGEGMAGQCALEKEMIYLKDVPSNFVSITSGLGETTPRFVLIAPMMINEEIYGVIELASFNEFLSHHREFITELSENIAATIKTVRDSDTTLHLLNASQQQAEELKAQEEEMRQNMEELQATQEEMQRKSDELNRATSEMQGIIAGIDATMATIEFTPDGTILAANSNFLNAVKYALPDIVGKHHRIFAPKDVLESEDYKTFWQRLAAGESFTGTFKRVDSTGDTVWLNAIYNPIFNSKGQVAKVVKFATNITAEKERQAESQGILEGINATMATIEFKPDGTIISANSNFLKTVKYSMPEINGKHHRIFVPQDVLESEEYKTFWARLAGGESLTGVFKRVASTGETVWLNAIYNPIRNSNGEVVKVVKFATDITVEKMNELTLQ